MKRLKMSKLIISCSLCTAIPVSIMPYTLQAQNVKTSAQKINEVSQHFKAVRTMKAGFVQTNRLGQQVRGTMILRRPGKVRFEYKNDQSLLIVADGKALTMVDYEVNQVQRWPIKNSPLSALLDTDKDLTRFGKIIETNNENVISVEVRDPKRPEYGVITMIFSRQASAPAGLNLVGWVALDSKNNRTTIKLDNVQFNTSVSENSFKWRDPRRRGGPRGR